MHAEYYQGLLNNWDYGPIYCSQITKKLFFNKFPKLQKVYQLQLNKKHIIRLNSKNEINCQVYFFDSNHCAGSVMFVFVGYFGTILHTGDMRFNIKSFENDNRLNLDGYRTKTVKQIFESDKSVYFQQNNLRHQQLQIYQDIKIEHFITNINDGWIEIIRKNEKHKE